MEIDRCPQCHFKNPLGIRYCGACGAKLPRGDEGPLDKTETLISPLTGLPVGSTFAGRYFVLEELGRGGMGRVYRVQDKKLDVEIALKLIKPEIASDHKTIERFKNELKITRMISHNHVCRMFDLGEYEGFYFFTMEYVQGEDLKSTIKRVGPLSVSKVLAVAKQVCDGLRAAHGLGVVHRDLKPQNIMVDLNGNVRIMDFGISRSLQARGITAEGIMIGTPEYISPEQAEGIKVDARSDIYSLGIVLFEMVTGKVPFEGDTTLSVIMKHKLEPPPDPQALNPQLPKKMRNIILKCLEKDRQKRYPNVEALAADLEAMERTLHAKEEALSDRKAKGKTPTNHYKKYWMATIPLAALALLISGYFILKRAPKVTGVMKPPAQVTPNLQQGILEINSDPEGAQVIINGKVKGTTPLLCGLPPDQYEIQVNKSSEYREATESLVLQAGEKVSRTYALGPLYWLEIVTEPEEADIIIDGRFVGQTPKIIELSKKNCILKIQKGKDWMAIQETLSLNPGRNLIRRSLKKKLFNLTIETDPPEARISLGDEPSEPAPVQRQVEPGIYKVRIEKEGYATIQEVITLSTDLAKSYNLLKLPPGKILFNVQPYADVYVDDKLLGEVPPLRTQEVEEGKHTVKFVSARLGKDLSVSVEIASGETKEVRVNMISGDIKILKRKGDL